LGVKIPEQLSVTGFDNIEIAEHLEVPLTTVAQDFKGIGRRAAEIVIHTLEKGASLNEQVVLPVELVIRKSSGTPG
jgi:DNA-binding LacI/PurR family transcriptional regulator